MYGDSVCETCKKSFHWRRIYSQSIPKFCSKKCRLITSLNEDEKKEIMKKSFEKNVIKKDGCWGWKGNIAKDGYARMSCSPSLGAEKSHIASYIIHKGFIPKGMKVLHRCDVRHCTSPDHLFLGTSKENSEDMVNKGRQARGSTHGFSKLNEDQVKEIKKFLSIGINGYEIGIRFNVSKSNISRIKRGVTWKHIPNPT